MTALRFSAIALVTCVGSCSDERSQGVQQGPADALTIAKDYADSHYPKGTFQPDGARLEYFVEDAGDVWKTELGPVGYLGGGLQVVVRKSDMKVISALRTQ